MKAGRYNKRNETWIPVNLSMILNYVKGKMKKIVVELSEKDYKDLRVIANKQRTDAIIRKALRAYIGAQKLKEKIMAWKAKKTKKRNVKK